MKKLIVVLALLGLTAPARAGLYYDNIASSSSDTLRVAGVVKIANPSSPYVPTITINGVGGAITATTFTGALSGNSTTASALAANGTNCSAAQAARGVDASGNAEDCFAAGGGDALLAGNQTWTGLNTHNSTSTFKTLTNFTNTYSTQAVFSGFSSRGGPDTASGQITLGTSLRGRIQYDDAISGDMFIENAQDSTSSDIYFCLRAGGANENCNLRLRGDAEHTSVFSGVTRFENVTSTQIVVSGYASRGGAAVQSGQLNIGLNYGVIQYDDAVTGALFIENRQNFSGSDIVFRVNALGTEKEPLRAKNNGTIYLADGAATQLYYCNGGTFAGNVGRGAGAICTGGTATALGIYVP